MSEAESGFSYGVRPSNDLVIEDSLKQKLNNCWIDMIQIFQKFICCCFSLRSKSIGIHR